MLGRKFPQAPGLLVSLMIAFGYHYPRLVGAYNLEYPSFYALLIILLTISAFSLSYRIQFGRVAKISLCVLSLILLWQSRLWLLLMAVIFSVALLAQALRQEGFCFGYPVLVSLLLGLGLSYLCLQSADFVSLNIIVLLILLIKWLFAP